MTEPSLMRPAAPAPEIPCTSRVTWWDGEYEGECELAEGHEGPHSDGLSHWDDEGEMIP